MLCSWPTHFSCTLIIPLSIQKCTVQCKAWFSFVGKIPDDQGFYFFLTISDFADISDMRQSSVPDCRDYELFICDRGTGAQQFRGLVINERNPSPMDANVLDDTNLSFHLSGMIADHWENRNAPDSPDLSRFIPDDRGYLRFGVFISRLNLGWSGNSKSQTIWDFPDI